MTTRATAIAWRSPATPIRSSVRSTARSLTSTAASRRPGRRPGSSSGAATRSRPRRPSREPRRWPSTNMNGDNAEEPGPAPDAVAGPVVPASGRRPHPVLRARAERERVHEPLAWSVLRVPARHRLLPVHRLRRGASNRSASTTTSIQEPKRRRSRHCTMCMPGRSQQETFPGRASEYAATVRGFEQASLARRLDGRWLFRGLGALATVRLPAALGWPDLDKSEGVVGVRDLPQGRYVALAPREESVSGLCPPPRHAGPIFWPPMRPSCPSSARTPASLLHLRGHMPVEVEIGGCARDRFRSTELRLRGRRSEKASTMRGRSGQFR